MAATAETISCGSINVSEMMLPFSVVSVRSVTRARYVSRLLPACCCCARLLWIGTWHAEEEVSGLKGGLRNLRTHD